jgi:hypothetical protein
MVARDPGAGHAGSEPDHHHARLEGRNLIELGGLGDRREGLAPRLRSDDPLGSVRTGRHDEEDG